MTKTTIGLYGITCRGCEQRKNETDEHLKAHGINVQWIRGMNGRHAGLQTAHSYNADDPNNPYYITSGHASLCVNHWFAWQYALISGCDYAIFFEDDCRVVDGFNTYLQARMADINSTDPDWDFVYLGHFEGSDNPAFQGQCYEWKEGSIGRCKTDPYGTHCYAVSMKALPILIDRCERIYTHIDVAIWNEVIPCVSHYACIPPLAGQKRNESIYSNTLSQRA
jgi:GR25 family glycosyltransferase involved in LPS biosynthesis